MRRPTLRSQLNQIRLWVRQGRTDPWIAHKLDISLEQLRTFKRDQGLDAEPTTSPPTPEEVEAELVEEAASSEEIPAEEPADESPQPEPDEAESETEAETEAESEAGSARRRRRGRRGGRRRAAKSADLYEATFEHGDEGYGLWLDPAVAENEVYSEHWAGHRPVSVTIEADAITIRRIEEAEDG